MGNGVITGQRVRGLHRVGVYVPGGTAGYPSSVLMNVIPAQVAEVGEIIMVTPPGRTGKPDPNILAAAPCGRRGSGVSDGRSASGAALAYGTESVPKVDKIVGPGNIFVATAKAVVWRCGHRYDCGPRAILIAADDSANPNTLAADLMSQAEHDRLASAILITNSEQHGGGDGKGSVPASGDALPKGNHQKRRWTALSGRQLFRSMEQAVECQRLRRLSTESSWPPRPLRVFGQAGAIAGSAFFGPLFSGTPGDYLPERNHVLPTGVDGRPFSPLSVDDFIKKSSSILLSGRKNS